MGRTGKGRSPPRAPIPPVTGSVLGVNEPQHHTHTHGPAPVWAPPSYRHLRQHRAVRGGGRDPRNPSGKAQADPGSPPQPWGRMERNSRGVTRHVRGTGRRNGRTWLNVPTVCPSPLPHPDRRRGPSAFAAPFGVQDQARWAVTPAQGSAAGVAPTLPPPPCRAPWWLGHPPPRSDRSSRPGCPGAAAPW